MHPNDISPQKNAFRPRRVDAPPKGMVKKKNEKNVKRIIFGTGKSWVVGGEKMKVRERLMRKVMAVVIAAATIFSISGGTKVVPVKAAVEVAEVLDLNENLRGQYGTLPEAFVAAQNGDTIRLLSDISDTSLTIGYNPVESGKHIILDLNGRNLTMNELNVTYSLMVKNGTMNCRLTNGNTGSGYNAPLTISKVNFSTSFLQWMPDDGVVLESGTTVTVSDSTSAQCFFEKLTMQESCVFKVGTNAYISNYKHDEHGLDAVTDFVPEGYSIGVYQAPLGTDQYVTIADKAGNIATNYELRYRTLRDSQLTVKFNPDTYVYDGNEKKPAVKVIYDGQTLIENTSYTLTYADNKNAGTASVTIKGKNSLHGQIVEYFTIQKADQNAPTGLTPTAETIDGKNDGQITNLATTMEYSVDQTSWTACTGTTLTQHSDGDYYVRYKETNNYYASPSTKVVVAKGATPSPTGEQTTTGEQATTQQTSVEQPDGATTQQTFVEQPDGATTQAGAPKTTEADKKTDKAVSTGDAYPIAIMITLMLGAGVGITGMIRRRKEK